MSHLRQYAPFLALRTQSQVGIVDATCCTLAVLIQYMLLGIVLHVEPNGGQPSCDLTFHRVQTSAVTIGRKSSSDHKLGQGDDGSGNVGFACQVVSGRHAKLAFSDSGYVNIFLTSCLTPLISSALSPGLSYRFRISSWNAYPSPWGNCFQNVGSRGCHHA